MVLHTHSVTTFLFRSAHGKSTTTVAAAAMGQRYLYDFASLRLMANMACVLFGLTVEEALAGITREAARALGLPDRGVLVPGCRADLAIWSAQHPNALVYEPMRPALWQRVLQGEPTAPSVR